MPWTSAFAAQPARSVAHLVEAVDEPSELAARAASIENWPGVVDCAFKHGLGGLLLMSLDRADIDLPSAVVEDARPIMARDRLWYRKLSTELAEVVEALEQADVAPVILKGPALAERTYPDPALRPSGDLDLLVSPAEFERAREALIERGMRDVTSPTRPDRRPHALEFETPGQARVELHWQASSREATVLDSEPLVARAIPYLMRDGLETRILSPADELLFLSVHAARHRLTRLRWLWEIGRLLQSCSEEELDGFIERTHGSKVTRAVAVTLWVLSEKLGSAVAGECARRLPGGLLLRVELAIAGLIPGDDYRHRGLVGRGLLTLSEHTYRALLNGKTTDAMRQWTHSVRRSIGSLVSR